MPSPKPGSPPSGGQGLPPGLYGAAVTRALLLGVLVTAGVAWLLSVPAVIVALVCASIPAFLTPRLASVRLALLATVGGALFGGLAGSLTIGEGSLPFRLGAGVVAGLAVGPWLAIWGLTRRPSRRGS